MFWRIFAVFDRFDKTDWIIYFSSLKRTFCFFVRFQQIIWFFGWHVPNYLAETMHSLIQFDFANIRFMMETYYGNFICRWIKLWKSLLAQFFWIVKSTNFPLNSLQVIANERKSLILWIGTKNIISLGKTFSLHLLQVCKA